MEIQSIEQLIALVDTDVNTAYQDTKQIQAIRKDAYRYYSLLDPKPRYRWDARVSDWVQDGSAFVAADVMDAVEQIKAVGTDAFGRSNQPVKYGPETGPDIEQAQEWAEYVFYRQNNGEEIIRHGLHEAALAKFCPVTVKLEVDTEDEPFELDGLVADQAMMISQHPSVIEADVQGQVVEIEPGVYQEVFSVSGIRQVQTPRIDLDTPNPEDFFISGTGLGDGEWDLVGHTESALYDDLIEQGYDEEMVRRLPDRDRDSQRAVSLARREFDQERSATDDTSTRGRQGQGRYYKRVTHAFIRLKINDQPTAIYYLMYGRQTGAYLDFRKVDNHWYEAFHAYQIPGKFYGFSAFELVKSVQDTGSMVKREMANSIRLSNRYQKEILETGINKEYREEIEDALDAVDANIWVRQPGTVRQIPRLPLPQETLPFLEALAQEKEARTGITRVAGGMNGDVLSKQNAKDMVEHYINLGERRVGMMIRANAKGAMKGIFRRIYDLTRDNAEMFDGQVIEVGGEDQQIMPSAWRPNPDLEIQTALTGDEREKEMSALLAWDERLSAQKQQDPIAMLMYQDQNKVAIYRRIADLMNLPVEMVMTTPDDEQWQAAQQSAAEGQEQAMQEQLMQTQKQVEVIDAQIARLNTQNTVDLMKTTADIQNDQEKLELDRREFRWGQIVNMKELELEDEQERPVSIAS